MLNVKCCVLEFWGAALKAGYNKPGSQLGQILHALWGEKISGYLTQNWLLCQILWDMAIGRGAHLHPHTTGLNYCMNVPGKLKITCHNEFALLFSPFSISFLNQAKLDWLKWFLKVHLRLFCGHKITPNLLESVSVYQMIIITPYAKLVQCYLACRSCRYVCSTIVWDPHYFSVMLWSRAPIPIHDNCLFRCSSRYIWHMYSRHLHIYLALLKHSKLKVLYASPCWLAPLTRVALPSGWPAMENRRQRKWWMYLSSLICQW